jgi:hypothetical protein
VRRRPRLIVDDYGTLRRYKWCSGCDRWLVLSESFNPRRMVRKNGTVNTGWDSRCRWCDAARCRSNQSRWRHDPVKGAEYREARRMQYRLRQARRGRPVPPLSEQQYEARYGKGWTRRYSMPREVVAAVAALIESELENGRDLEAIAAMAGMPGRRLWAIRHGEGGSLPVIDRLCIALGVSLSEVT